MHIFSIACYSRKEILSELDLEGFALSDSLSIFPEDQRQRYEGDCNETKNRRSPS